MEVIRLPEPRPRRRPLASEPFTFPLAGVHYLTVSEKPPDSLFFAVLNARRSRRSFGPLSEEALSLLLWHSAKTHELQRNEDGTVWQHRGVPSAGGVHPINVFLFGPCGCAWESSRYDSTAHALCNFELPLGYGAEMLRREISAVLEPQDGTVLLFFVDFARIEMLYEGGESLMWRDAGALLATLALTAEALQLSCCSLGITGDKILQHFLPADRFSGVGGMIVGSRCE